MSGPEVSLTVQARTGPIILRHPRLADYESWWRLRELSRESLSLWEPEWDGNLASRKAFKQRLAVYRRLVAAGTAFPFHVMTEDGELVGACNLSEVKRSVARSGQIGYWIGSPFMRRGYGLAAVEAVTDFAFAHLSLHRVEAAVQADNIASVSLLEKAGYHFEGVARGYLQVGGAWRDHAIYSRLATDPETSGSKF